MVAALVLMAPKYAIQPRKSADLAATLFTDFPPVVLNVKLPVETRLNPPPRVIVNQRPKNWDAHASGLFPDSWGIAVLALNKVFGGRGSYRAAMFGPRHLLFGMRHPDSQDGAALPLSDR